MTFEYKDLLKTVIEGTNLSEQQAYEMFCRFIGGELSEVKMAAVLAALAAKGHSVAEITGAAQAMREKAEKVPIPEGMDVVDIVGTGGTGISTFNVSTASCIVAAGAGAKVAKHGNVTNTRASGAANVLVALGVNIDVPPDVVGRCVEEAGMGFCFAKKCHPAMKNVAGVRKEMAVQTIFNILGPLTNPAGAKRFLMGVFSWKWAGILARVLGRLGAEEAWVVSGEDGMDEISITGPTKVARLSGGKIDTFDISPDDWGIPGGSVKHLAVGSPEESAGMIRELLAGKGEKTARNIVLLNSAAALVVSGVFSDMASGLEAAARSVDSGAAAEVLEKLVIISCG